MINLDELQALSDAQNYGAWTYGHLNGQLIVKINIVGGDFRMATLESKDDAKFITELQRAAHYMAKELRAARECVKMLRGANEFGNIGPIAETLRAYDAAAGVRP